MKFLTTIFVTLAVFLLVETAPQSHVPYYKNGKAKEVGNNHKDYNDPAVYNYNYEIGDYKSGDHKMHEENRLGDEVSGEYSYLEPDGNLRTVKYSVDKDSGFNVVMTNKNNQLPTKLKHIKEEPTYYRNYDQNLKGNYDEENIEPKPINEDYYHHDKESETNKQPKHKKYEMEDYKNKYEVGIPLEEYFKYKDIKTNHNDKSKHFEQINNFEDYKPKHQSTYEKYKQINNPAKLENQINSNNEYENKLVKQHQHPGSIQEVLKIQEEAEYFQENPNEHKIEKLKQYEEIDVRDLINKQPKRYESYKVNNDKTKEKYYNYNQVDEKPKYKNFGNDYKTNYELENAQQKKYNKESSDNNENKFAEVYKLYQKHINNHQLENIKPVSNQNKLEKTKDSTHYYYIPKIASQNQKGQLIKVQEPLNHQIYFPDYTKQLQTKIVPKKEDEYEQSGLNYYQPNLEAPKKINNHYYKHEYKQKPKSYVRINTEHDAKDTENYNYKSIKETPKKNEQVFVSKEPKYYYNQHADTQKPKSYVATNIEHHPEQTESNENYSEDSVSEHYQSDKEREPNSYVETNVQHYPNQAKLNEEYSEESSSENYQSGEEKEPNSYVANNIQHYSKQTEPNEDYSEESNSEHYQSNKEREPNSYVETNIQHYPKQAELNKDYSEESGSEHYQSGEEKEPNSYVASNIQHYPKQTESNDNYSEESDSEHYQSDKQKNPNSYVETNIQHYPQQTESNDNYSKESDSEHYQSDKQREPNSYVETNIQHYPQQTESNENYSEESNSEHYQSNNEKEPNSYVETNIQHYPKQTEANEDYSEESDSEHYQSNNEKGPNSYVASNSKYNNQYTESDKGSLEEYDLKHHQSIAEEPVESKNYYYKHEEHGSKYTKLNKDNSKNYPKKFEQRKIINQNKEATSNKHFETNHKLAQSYTQFHKDDGKNVESNKNQNNKIKNFDYKSHGFKNMPQTSNNYKQLQSEIEPHYEKLKNNKEEEYNHKNQQLHKYSQQLLEQYFPIHEEFGPKSEKQSIISNTKEENQPQNIKKHKFDFNFKKPQPDYKNLYSTKPINKDTKIKTNNGLPTFKSEDDYKQQTTKTTTPNPKSKVYFPKVNRPKPKSEKLNLSITKEQTVYNKPATYYTYQHHGIKPEDEVTLNIEQPHSLHGNLPISHKNTPVYNDLNNINSYQSLKKNEELLHQPTLNIPTSITNFNLKHQKSNLPSSFKNKDKQSVKYKNIPGSVDYNNYQSFKNIDVPVGEASNKGKVYPNRLKSVKAY